MGEGSFFSLSLPPLPLPTSSKGPKAWSFVVFLLCSPQSLRQHIKRDVNSKISEKVYLGDSRTIGRNFWGWRAPLRKFSWLVLMLNDQHQLE